VREVAGLREVEGARPTLPSLSTKKEEGKNSKSQQTQRVRDLFIQAQRLKCHQPGLDGAGVRPGQAAAGRRLVPTGLGGGDVVVAALGLLGRAGLDAVQEGGLGRGLGVFCVVCVCVFTKGQGV
jgi:hypothetical protein